MCGFCLASSDSDFTRLAARIRKQGIDVFGFEEQKAPESFRHIDNEDGWVPLGVVGNQLANLTSGFGARTDGFEIETPKGGY